MICTLKRISYHDGYYIQRHSCYKSHSYTIQHDTFTTLQSQINPSLTKITETYKAKQLERILENSPKSTGGVYNTIQVRITLFKTELTETYKA